QAQPHLGSACGPLAAVYRVEAINAGDPVPSWTGGRYPEVVDGRHAAVVARAFKFDARTHRGDAQGLQLAAYPRIPVRPESVSWVAIGGRCQADGGHPLGDERRGAGPRSGHVETRGRPRESPAPPAPRRPPTPPVS